MRGSLRRGRPLRSLMLQRARRGLARWRCGSLRAAALAEPSLFAGPGALALRLVAGRVAARRPLRADVAVQRALLGPDAPRALLLPALLLPALAASVLAHRHSMAVSLQPESELLSIAKVFS